MSLTLTNAQLDAIAAKILVLQDAATTRLPTPQDSTGPASIAAALDPLVRDAAGNKTMFSELGIAIADFTADVNAPRIWLHNSGLPWRVASTAKTAMLLSAMQLRDDVRAIQAMPGGLVQTSADFDALFAMPKLWGSGANTTVRQIAGPRHVPPRVSTIFDITPGTPATFLGPDADTPDPAALNALLPPGGHLTWRAASRTEFSERLWLAGAWSDNVAATACISEIGIAYIRAVQRAYGLFLEDQRLGMRLLLGGGYKGIAPNTEVSPGTSKTYRQLRNTETQRVGDALRVGGAFTDHDSVIGGSAKALIALLIAMQQNKLTAFGHSAADAGKAGCLTLRQNLSHGGALQTQSYIANGAQIVTDVTTQITKIGLLGVADEEPDDFNCEFAYLETKERAGGGKVKKYGVVATAITPPAGFGVDIVTLTTELGRKIHEALITV